MPTDRRATKEAPPATPPAREAAPAPAHARAIANATAVAPARAPATTTTVAAVAAARDPARAANEADARALLLLLLLAHEADALALPARPAVAAATIRVFAQPPSMTTSRTLFPSTTPTAALASAFPARSAAKRRDASSPPRASDPDWTRRLSRRFARIGETRR